MPPRNGFQHQTYPTVPVIRPVQRLLEIDDGQSTDFSVLHTRLGYGHVVLVHGTFMGNDGFGIAATLRDMAGGSDFLQSKLEALADEFQSRGKSVVDRVAGEYGNYTDKFRDAFQQLVGDDPVIRLMEPTWSGQNHHLARADLAVRLLCLLDDLRPGEFQRALLWGHSHAGNGFAILTNLLANDPASVDRFFGIASLADAPHWQRAREILGRVQGPHPYARFTDIAAFGTPVRYGWDTSGCGALVHILHHRNFDPADPWRTHPLFPPQPVADITRARYGDWIQTFGIAGTDLTPPTRKEASAAMGKLLETGLPAPQHGLDTKFLPLKRVRDACARWKTGTRCHTDGWNLLVDYKPSGRKAQLVLPIEEVLLGHGVATVIDWLPSHLALVTRALQRLRPA